MKNFIQLNKLLIILIGISHCGETFSSTGLTNSEIKTGESVVCEGWPQYEKAKTKKNKRLILGEILGEDGESRLSIYGKIINPKDNRDTKTLSFLLFKKMCLYKEDYIAYLKTKNSTVRKKNGTSPIEISKSNSDENNKDLSPPAIVLSGKDNKDPTERIILDNLNDELHVDKLLENDNNIESGGIGWGGRMANTLGDVVSEKIGKENSDIKKNEETSLVNNQPSIVYRETVKDYIVKDSNNDSHIAVIKKFNSGLDYEALINLSFVVLNMSLFMLIYLSDWIMGIFRKNK